MIKVDIGIIGNDHYQKSEQKPSHVDYYDERVSEEEQHFGNVEEQSICWLWLQLETKQSQEGVPTYNPNYGCWWVKVVVHQSNTIGHKTSLIIITMETN